ncbi:MAG: response regulator [Myxococcota bacterium]
MLHPPGAEQTTGMRTTGAVGAPRVLVVDDEEDIRESLRSVLELEGFQVLTAENGRAAWTTLTSAPRPAVILLDLMMPVMNGGEFLAALRADAERQGIPVVVLTAFADRAGGLGADVVMEKPVDPEALFRVVHRLAQRGAR